ncbi:hypothetical protein EON68_03535, partial [archaeon]
MGARVAIRGQRFRVLASLGARACTAAVPPRRRPPLHPTARNMHRTLLLCVGAACLAALVASAPVLGRAAGLRGERAADAALSGRDHIGSLLEKLDLPPLMNCEYG